MAEGGSPNAGTGGGGYVIYRAWILKLTSPPPTANVLIAIIAELQATVLEQQRVIERLQRRIAELEGQAKPGVPPRMPGLKAKSAGSPQRSRGPASSDATALPAVA